MKIKKIYNNIRIIYSILRLNENILIFLFYLALRREYKSYFI